MVEETFAELAFSAIGFGESGIFLASLISPAVEAHKAASEFAHVKIGSIYVHGRRNLRKLLCVEPSCRMYLAVGKIIVQDDMWAELPILQVA